MRFSHPRRQRGAIAIMAALAMLVLLGVVGLVVDGGLAYLVKARLNAAVDSAALAGARAVTNGNNQAEQTANAQAAAAEFFGANIASGYMLSKPKLLSTTVTFDGGTAIIDVRAEAPMPVSVMQVMGFASLTPNAYAQTIRKDLDMALVVDTSGSLSSVGASVRASAKSFLNKFNVTQDRVTLVHFASGAEVDNAINPLTRGFDRTSMLKNIDAFTFKGGTSSVEGMWAARDQLARIPSASRSSMRVIVFFSDGAPTSFFTYLAFNTPTDCIDYGALDSVNGGTGLLDPKVSENGPLANAKCTLKYPASGSVKALPSWYNGHNGSWLLRNDPGTLALPIVTNTPRVVTSDIATYGGRNIDRAARNLAEAMADKARDDGVFVFTLGMGAGLKDANDYDPAETGETVLKCMANIADGPARCYNPAKPVGMYCYAATDADLTPCFSRLASAILRISK